MSCLLRFTYENVARVFCVALVVRKKKNQGGGEAKNSGQVKNNTTKRFDINISSFKSHHSSETDSTMRGENEVR